MKSRVVEMKYQRSLWTVLMFALCACGVEEVPSVALEGQSAVTGAPNSMCGDLAILEPLDGVIIDRTHFTVKGVTGATSQTSLTVDGREVEIQDGRFEVTLEKEDGNHTIEVVCDKSHDSRLVMVAAMAPRLTLDSPASGALILDQTGPVTVRGRLENHANVLRLRLNHETIAIDEDGSFTVEYTPTEGMNHLHLVVESLTGDSTDLTRSFLYGRFTDWEDDRSALIVADIRTPALAQLARGVESKLTTESMERLLEAHMGRNGDMELHEISYDRIQVDFEPRDQNIGVRVRLHEFALDLTYHYSVFGIGGRVRGWAHCRPVELRADIVLEETSEGDYDLTLQNPSVDMNRFELELNDFYSAVQELIQPLVRNMGRDLLLGALQGVLFEGLASTNLLSPELEIFGHRTQLNFEIDELTVSSSGIHTKSYATIEPFEAVKDDSIGFWTSSPEPIGHGDWSQLAVGMSIDLLNRMLGEAWRGGLLDMDMTALMADVSSLSVATVAGSAGAELLEHFDIDAGVRLHSRALMQPIAHIKDPSTGQIAVEMGAFEVTLSSVNRHGELVQWAVIEVAADFTAQPRFNYGHLSMDASLRTRIELVDSPLFPVQESQFESFLETLLNGASTSALNDLVDRSFRFSDIDIFGLGVGSIQFGSTSADPGFLTLGVDLAQIED